MQRIILHSDLDAYFASVEALIDENLREQAFAVCGNPKKRCGIILAKSEKAKQYGVKTGETIWQAKQKCPHLQLVPSQYQLYLKYARLVKAIYYQYTDRVESFGIDEAWLDVTRHDAGDGLEIARKIQAQVAKELGLSVSIGISFNKTFAKLGSDLKKPQGLSLISETNWQEVVWPLPVQALLGVGRKTSTKLTQLNIRTIGDLAQTDLKILQSYLGKSGEMLWLAANAKEVAPVKPMLVKRTVKSIGKSKTCAVDLLHNKEVKTLFLLLAENISEQLRAQQLLCGGIQIQIRDKDFYTFERQVTLSKPTCLAKKLAQTAVDLFKKVYLWEKPIRLIGLRAIALQKEIQQKQISLWPNEEDQKVNKIEQTLIQIRTKHGEKSVQKGYYFSETADAIFDLKSKATLPRK